VLQRQQILINSEATAQESNRQTTFRQRTQTLLQPTTISNAAIRDSGNLTIPLRYTSNRDAVCCIAVISTTELGRRNFKRN